MKNHFKTFISEFPNFTEDAYNIAVPFLTVKNVSKGDHILQTGTTCREITFVNSGIFRIYYLRDGVEITTCFCKENRFTTSYQSLITRKPSEHSIQALEDAEIVTIPYDNLLSLYEKHPFWQQIGRLVTEQEYLVTACYTRLINDKTAKQRYQDVLENEPDLLLRVSLTDLASYLQVTPETISRIRKALATS